jgi:hypothetical protein
MPSSLYVSNPLVPADTICPSVREKRRAFATYSCLSSVDIVARTALALRKVSQPFKHAFYQGSFIPILQTTTPRSPSSAKPRNMTSICLASSPISRVASENLQFNTVKSRERGFFAQSPCSISSSCSTLHASSQIPTVLLYFHLFFTL